MTLDPSAEGEVRAAWQASEYSRATECCLRAYGPEILAFLRARTEDSADADDIFGTVAEKIFVGIAHFEWRSSMRSWCYRIARNAALDFAKQSNRRRDVPLSYAAHAGISKLVVQLRTETHTHQKSDLKDRLRALRSELSLDDQMLLVLRVDRAMSWPEIVVAMADGTAEIEFAGQTTEAARLRKRFERVKQQLRELMRRDGLL